MSDYKPSTEELRQVWGMFSEYGGLVDRPEETLIDERYAEFNRWLETVKAEALVLYNASRTHNGTGNALTSWGQVIEKTRWLAVARKAREMNGAGE